MSAAWQRPPRCRDCTSCLVCSPNGEQENCERGHTEDDGGNPDSFDVESSFRIKCHALLCGIRAAALIWIMPFHALEMRFTAATSTLCRNKRQRAVLDHRAVDLRRRYRRPICQLQLPGEDAPADDLRRLSSPTKSSADAFDRSFLTSGLPRILLQKSKVAPVRIFGETLKRKSIDNSYRLFSVALPKSPMSLA